MNINEILRSGSNVQLVINALDLKEAFLQWNAEQKEESFPILQEEYKTPNETAKMLDVDKSTLWRWAKQGYLVPVKWGTNLDTNCQTLDVAWRAKLWKKRKKGDPKTAPNTTTKVHNPNDLCKVLDYFRYTVGTTLDCFFATGILRNCITWYVRDLENMGLLQAIYIARDRRTKFKAKHYSADPQKWQRKPQGTQFNLFEEG